MKVVLLQNLASLGQKGDIKNVSDGYAINFLLPQGKAVLATDENIKQLKAKINKKEADNKEQTQFYNKIVKTLHKQTMTLSGKVSDKETLFQGVGPKDIINAIKQNFNLDINEKWFRDTAVIKKIGRHEIILNLPNNIQISFYINIKAEEN